MTKAQYIRQHPKSYLATALLCNQWPDDIKIEIIGGLNAPYNKCSNLFAALKRSEFKMHCVGGHRYRGTEGWWMAVA